MSAHGAFLVVDDDPIALAVAETILRSVGVGSVVCASSGSEGLAHLSKNAGVIDCVLLDLNMPHLDGLGFMREAAKARFNGKLIVVSGEGDAILRSAGRMAELLGIKILGVVKKPLRTTAISALLDAVTPVPTVSNAEDQISAALAVGSGELLPYYQPQHSIGSGRIEGVEALIRVRGPDGKIHGPGKVFGSNSERNRANHYVHADRFTRAG